MNPTFLLIDDEAQKGWSEVLLQILKKQYGPYVVLEVLADPEADLTLLNQQKYSLIFLDLRFGEGDHFQTTFTELTGYKLLQKLRGENSLNFPTPVIIFSASTKIWIVEELLQQGADSYYIKENPLYAFEESFTKNNYTRFLKELERLSALSQRRGIIWKATQGIKEKAAKQIHNKTIEKRIREKLHIGYGLLFRNTSKFETQNFFYTNEVLGFIVFWSILEEIAKDFYLVDWRNEPKDYSWKVRGTDKYFIQDKTQRSGSQFSGNLTIVQATRKEQKFVTKTLTPDPEKPLKEFMVSNSRRVNLSDQIASLLHLKYDWNYSTIYNRFLKPLNNYRNNIDFIHGDALLITTKTISETFKQEDSFGKCVEVLEFIDELLSK